MYPVLRRASASGGHLSAICDASAQRLNALTEFESKREKVFGPIVMCGTIYSLIVAVAIHARAWEVAAAIFCFGLTLLGARIA